MRKTSRGVLTAAAVIAAAVSAPAQTIPLPLQPSATSVVGDDLTTLTKQVRLAWAGTESPAGPSRAAEPSTPSAAQAPPPDPAAAQAPAPVPGKEEPLAFADWTWMTGNPRTKESPIDMKAFTAEIRFDSNFTYSFNKPLDNTLG